jgi:cobalt/nickel transport system ATP-binding protein
MIPAVELHNLHYRYPDGREALQGVSCTIAEGECVGLIGPNGAGKSTLLQHLNGILPEKLSGDGAVRVFGMPVTAASLPEIRRSVGLLFQDPDDQLFCPTVEEDVGFGPRQFGVGPGETRNRIRTALAQVGLAGSEQRSPHHLSGGEKRRVCLAGVLACSPRLLALDEPTSDLDPRGKRELRTILKALPATKLIASHDLELIVGLCARVIVLDAGRVVAEGPTAVLLSDEPLMLRHGLEKPHILTHRHPHTQRPPEQPGTTGVTLLPPDQE